MAICVIAGTVATGCAKDSTASPTTPAAVTTLPASTTTEPATTTTNPYTATVATTVPELSRDARVALARCFEALHPFLAESAALGGDDIDVAKDACDEAKLQLDVDDADPDLTLAVAEANLVLAFAKVDQIGGSIDEAALQADVDRISAELAKWMG